MGEKLKVAVLGVGGIAGAHMPGWIASEDAEIVAGCDVNSEILTKWGADHQISKLYEDVSQVWLDDEIDVVDICTPNMYHAPLSIAALQAGKHVLCEKPLAPTPEEVLKMIEARDRSGKMLMTAQSVRFTGNAISFKEEVDSGSLGNVYHARCWALRRAGVPNRPGFIQKRHSGGGPCIDIGVHMLDLALWFMGNPQPLSVSGMAVSPLAKRDGAFSEWGRSVIPSEYDVEDFAAGFVRFNNGATLVLEMSWMLHHGDAQNGVWMYGDEGGGHWPSCTFYGANNKTKQLYDKKLQLHSDGIGSHAEECIAFARAIVNNEHSPVPAEESLQVTQILDGIYRSQEHGTEVSLG
tara:strand:- start:588 stop:1640 length:1053 start_codon:yes stop_codon:yes gene_type:complete